MIALCIALETIESQERGATRSEVDPAWVRQQALEWWPKGFQDDTSLEGFRTILDEMIGLGVVRRAEAHTYTLRSPNLANLLGTQKEIEEQLLEAGEREPPAPYEALHFRRGLADHPAVRSPLTSQQEAELLAPATDVVLVCGSQLAEMDEIVKFLPFACPGPCEILEIGTVIGDVTECIDSFRGNEARLCLVVVSSSCGWTNHWVSKTVELLKRKRSRGRFVRVVFVADPQQVWSWTAKSSSRQQLLARGVRELSLRPWTGPSLRRWLDDLGIALGEKTGRQQIQAVTGAWASPLRNFAERCQQESHRWQQHLAELETELLENPTWKNRLVLRSEAIVLCRTMAELGEPLDREDLGMMAGASLDSVESCSLLGGVALVCEEGHWKQMGTRRSPCPATLCPLSGMNGKRVVAPAGSQSIHRVG